MEAKDIAAIVPLNPIQKSIALQEDTAQVAQFVVRTDLSPSADQIRAAWRQTVAAVPVTRGLMIIAGMDKPVLVIAKEGKAEVNLQKTADAGALEAFIQAQRDGDWSTNKPPLVRLAASQSDSGLHIILSYRVPLLDQNGIASVYQSFHNALQAEIQGTLVSWTKQPELTVGFTATAGAASNAWTGNTTALPQAKSVKPGARGVLCWELDSAVQDLLGNHGENRETLYRAAFAVLMARFCGQDQISYNLNRCNGTAELGMGFFSGRFQDAVTADGETKLVDLLRELNSKPVNGFATLEAQPQQLPYQLNLGLELGQGEHRGPGNATLALNIDSNKHILQWDYDTAALDQQQVRRIAAQFQHLLRDLCGDSSRPLSLLSPLDKAETQFLSRDFNQTRTETRPPALAYRLFEDWAEKTPEAVALSGPDTLTYETLNQQANQLAHYLRELGIGPETLVGISLKRHTAAIVALLAVQKAGGAYLPLDPEYPFERLAFMLEDAAPPVIITDNELVDNLPSHWGQLVMMDESDDWSDLPTENPEPLCGGDNRAYVIYTSGSTGRPKGVEVMHRGLANLALAQARHFGIQPGKTVLQFASFNFDASVSEILTAICAGACLCLEPQERIMPGPDLVELFQERRITHVTLPPSLLANLPHNDLPFPETIVVAGEACSEALTALWSQGRRFINAYGPTETTVCATMSDCQDGSRKPPIGRPIENMTVYLLDGKGRLVPRGVPGEIHVGGIGLAKGYLNRPELTEERFIQHPFQPGERLYKTGDLAFLDESDQLVYIGRNDHQVKIRGFRIETGEIESRILDEGWYEEVIVIAREDEPGRKRLVAYMTAVDPESTPEIAELRENLSQNLPDYMVPTHFCMLEAMPLTSNGKIDRAALPKPEDLEQEQATGLEAPSSEVEITLCRIWAEVLGREEIAVNQNFFELGGDSILCIQIVTKAAREDIHFTVKEMFAAQTPAKLAQIARIGEGAQKREIAPLSGAIGMLPIQHWFLEQGQTEPNHYNQSTLLSIDKTLESEHIEAAVKALVRRHDALRLRLIDNEESGGRELFIHAQDALGHLEDLFFDEEDFSLYPQEAVAPLLADRLDEVQAEMDLDAGLVLRVQRFIMPGPDDRLLVVIHHMAVDGVSWPILLDDFETAIRQLEKGETVALSRATHSLADQHQFLQELAQNAGDTELSFWKQQKGAPLPTDLDGEGRAVAQSAEVEIHLDQARTQTLVENAGKHLHAGMDAVLLAALTQAVTQWSGHDHLYIARESHGRGGDLDLSATVGWFTALYPLTLCLGSSAGSRDLTAMLRAAKESLRAVPAEGLGYGALRYLSNDHAIRAALAEQPQPEIAFNYLGKVDAAGDEQARFRGAPESAGRNQAQSGKRAFPLEINGQLENGVLSFVWTYGTDRYHEQTIARIARVFQQALENLADLAIVDRPEARTPGDFPHTNLSQAQLDLLCSRFPDLEDIYPISPMQEGMIYHTLFEPGSIAYVEQLDATMENLDVDAFRAAWTKVTQTHAVLRTRFVYDGLDQGMQVVSAGTDNHFQVEDLRGREDLESAWEQALEADLREGFDFNNGVPVRIKLFRCDENSYRIIWTHHHALLDGWSVQLVMRQLFETYGALRNGEAAPHLETAPYGDYIRRLCAQDRTDMERFWRENLCDYDADKRLPRKNGAKSNQTQVQGEIILPLSEQLTAELQRFAQSRATTLNTLVQGMWGLVLARFSNAEEAVFGVTVSGRPPELPGVDHMVGLFINTLPLRVRLPQNQNVGEWLTELSEQQAELFSHYAMSSLVDIQQWSGVPQGKDLFESLLIFENYPLDEAIDGLSQDLGLSEARVSEQTNYPLNLMVNPGKQLHLRGYFDKDQFERPFIERMLNHLAYLLEVLPLWSEKPLSQWQLLPAAERSFLLETLNDSQRPLPANNAMHRGFEAIAERTPEAVALQAQDGFLFYGELEQQANQLAQALQTKGIGRGKKVALIMTRDCKNVVAVAAVLKTGAAYVPMDSAFPDGRLQYMLEDSEADLVIANRAVAMRLQLPEEKTWIQEDLEQIWSPFTTDKPMVDIAAKDPAYMIYTSGTTGLPKGVVIPHGAVVNFLSSMAEEPGLSSEDRLLAVTTLSFDIAVLEWWLPLSLGATLILANSEEAGDGFLLASRLEKDGITAMQATPSTWRMLLESGWSANPKLKIMCGGEALPPDLARHLTESGAELWNLYGPTETTIWSTVAKVPARSEQITIGHPIANTRVYLLDEQNQPVPRGVPGRLFIGGAGVALGYHRRPELTAERFIEDPFSREPGARMYFTGDIARINEAGALECLGRTDHQVKIRGYRIETEEIRAVLNRRDDIRDAVVVALADDRGEHHLFAYVVANGQLAEDGELRAYLGRHLPEYMFPTAFIELDALPLTANGKIDRKALPEPGRDTRIAYRAPQSATEITLAALWCDVLGLEKIGLDDHFMLSGGHSLLATRLAYRIRGSFGKALSLKAIFESTSLEDMAEKIDKAATLDDQTGGEIAVTLPDKTRLSFAQERLWFLAKLNPTNTAYHITSAVRLKGVLDEARLRETLEMLVQRHELLRAAFPEENGQPYLHIGEGPEVVLPQSRYVEDEGAAVDEIHAAPFDLEQGPLFRFRLLQTADDAHILVLVLHHLITDGWSLGILVDEMSHIYSALGEGREPRLADIGLSYAAYAHHQRNAMENGHLDHQAHYWLDRLSGALPVLELPTDKARPKHQTFNGAHQPIHLDAAHTKMVRAFSQKHGVTPFSTLLAVYISMLHRYSGQNRILVGSSVAGRTNQGQENLVGLFTNTLVHEGDLERHPVFLDLVKAIAANAVEALDHQDYPFEQIIHKLNPERHLGRNPVFQVMFEYHNEPAPPLQLPGLEIDMFDNETAGAKFELTLELAEDVDQAGEPTIMGHLEYNSDLFEAAGIARMARHFQTLLASACDQPEQTVDALPLINEEERRALIHDYNLTHRIFEQPFVPEAFQNAVLTNPRAVAVRFEDQVLSYEELHHRVMTLAAHLRDQGCRAESPVALLLERSPEMIIAVLAVLCAGGAYVPFDPELPEQRLTYMLTESGAEILLGQENTIARHAWLKETNVQVLALDRGDALPSDIKPLAAPEPVTANQAAYMIFTSGSTGKPKLTLNHHAGLRNRLAWTAEHMQADEHTVFLQKTPYSFDVSVWELTLPFTLGAVLVIAQPGTHKDPAKLAELMIRERVNIVHFVPSMLQAFLEMVDASELTDLKHVICSGEALPKDLEQRFMAQSDADLWNYYGPTEAAIDVTAHRCNSETGGPATTVPIGKPVANTQIHILDAHMEPVPVGLPGELYIGGIQVARGYVGQPELTAERFIQDPFSQTSSAVLYRSGDLVRRLNDGNIVFLGRTDHQVKLRGFRIELGEIEAVMLERDEIKEAVVIARGQGSSQKLIAFYTGNAIDQSELRDHFSSRLAAYMIPITFHLDEMPLNANGKVDRKALAAIKIAEPARAFQAPRTPLEQTIADMWTGLLDKERIGLYDNFFELGGHSLIAVRFIHQINQRLGINLPLAVIFQAPTVAAFAREAERGLVNGNIVGSRSPVVPLKSNGSKAPFFCIHPMGGSVHVYIDLAGSFAADHPFYGIQQPGIDGEVEPLDNITQMAADYIAAMRDIQPEGPYHIGGWSFGGVIAYEMAQQLAQAGQEVETLALIDSHIQDSGVNHPTDFDYPLWLEFFALELELTFGVGLGITEKMLKKLEPEQQIKLVVERAVDSGAYQSEQYARAQAENFINITKKSLLALVNYRPRTYAGPVTLFRVKHFMDRLASAKQRGNGWTTWCTGKLDIHVLEGNHRTIVKRPVVTKLAALLEAELERGTTSSGVSHSS